MNARCNASSVFGSSRWVEASETRVTKAGIENDKHKMELKTLKLGDTLCRSSIGRESFQKSLLIS